MPVRTVVEGVPNTLDALYNGGAMMVFRKALVETGAGRAILQSPNGQVYIFGAPLAQTGSYILAGIRADTKSVADVCANSGICGTVTNVDDFSQLVRQFMAQGWRKITPDGLPPDLKAYIIQAVGLTGIQLAQWMAKLSTVKVTPFVIPVWPLFNNPVIPDNFTGEET